MAKQRELLTYELVRELFDYKDGGLYWKSSRNGRGWAGDRFGRVHMDGYRNGYVHGLTVSEHRLIFLLHNGYYTENQIDHINRDKSDNRIENLREVSYSCNAKNCGLSVRSKSGVTGVTPNPRGNGWRVRVSIDGKLNHLKTCKELGEAVIVRWKAEVKHDYPDCNSTSSAYTYLREHGLIDCDGKLIEKVSVQ
jgi:hypothetical protein